MAPGTVGVLDGHFYLNHSNPTVDFPLKTEFYFVLRVVKESRLLREHACYRKASYQWLGAQAVTEGDGHVWT